jgi:hypothetical protein
MHSYASALSTAVDDRDQNQDTTESDADIQGRVADLARTFSRSSAVSAPRPSLQHTFTANPFLSAAPSLEPNSPEFDAKRWARTLLHAFSQDPEKYPRHTVGVAYRNVGVHGFGRPTDYQKDVLNVLWRAPLILRDWISNRQTKIQILRGMDGLVKSGEMLLVLGRPGRQVLTA